MEKEQTVMLSKDEEEIREYLKKKIEQTVILSKDEEEEIREYYMLDERIDFLCTIENIYIIENRYTEDYQVHAHNPNGMYYLIYEGDKDRFLHQHIVK